MQVILLSKLKWLRSPFYGRYMLTVFGQYVRHCLSLGQNSIAFDNFNVPLPLPLPCDSCTYVLQPIVIHYQYFFVPGCDWDRTNKVYSVSEGIRSCWKLSHRCGATWKYTSSSMEDDSIGALDWFVSATFPGDNGVHNTIPKEDVAGTLGCKTGVGVLLSSFVSQPLRQARLNYF